MKLGLRWSDLPSVTGGRLSGKMPGEFVGPVVIDSRALNTDDTFVAIKGQRSDGHNFIADVLKKGASGLILSRQIDGVPNSVNCLVVSDTVDALQKIGAAQRKLFPGRVVGITGSNGKFRRAEVAENDEDQYTPWCKSVFLPDPCFFKNECQHVESK